MNMITPRLQCIIDHINGNTVADIGTDHAYIPIKLIQEKRANKVISSDIRKGPCDIAKNNIKKYGLQDKIEVRTGSGCSVLSKNEADHIIIAGMGGKLICDIIKNDIEILREANIILQPMNYQCELRHFLHENNFKITGEDLSKEGFKVYNLLCVENGYQIPYKREIDYHIPPCLYNHKYFNELYEKKHREFSKIINGIENSKNKDIEKLEKYNILLNEIENLKL